MAYTNLRSKSWGTCTGAELQRGYICMNTDLVSKCHPSREKSGWLIHQIWDLCPPEKTSPRCLLSLCMHGEEKVSSDARVWRYDRLIRFRVDAMSPQGISSFHTANPTSWVLYLYLNTSLLSIYQFGLDVWGRSEDITRFNTRIISFLSLVDKAYFNCYDVLQDVIHSRSM